MNWQQIIPGVWRFADSCNVYAIEGPTGLLIVNAGSGRWLGALGDLPGRPAALACTHYFRDHSAGAAMAAKQGIPVSVPEGERAIFADPAQHFRERETYIIYDNLWDLFAPIEPVTPSPSALWDYETLRLAGLEVEVIPLPGVTLTQIGLGVTLPGGERIVCCGEAIHSFGRVARVAPYQYNYNDLSGAAQAVFSCRTLREWNPEMLFPSLGEPILNEPGAALLALEQNLRSLLAVRPGMTELVDSGNRPALKRITDHVWQDTHSTANTWYIISETGKVLAIDYGYHGFTCAAWQGYPRPARRRALLHGLGALREQFGIKRIDVVLVSHFHDDHVCGIPVIQRLHGTECWAAENFAELLAHPEAHCFPCDWPTPCRIDRRLPLDEEFSWEEYRFRLHPMSGHTRFAALIGFEADGLRFAHTGDQYFFMNGAGEFAHNSRLQNHVYRNGALLDGYDVSGRWMLDWRPKIVLQGHQPAFFTDEAFFDQIQGWVEDYRSLHEKVMPLGPDEAHLNLDSWGGWIWPYRTYLPSPAPFQVTATVRNPFPHVATLALKLVGPDGWTGSSAQVQADARAEISCSLTMSPDSPCRRQPIAIDVEADGRPLGQVAEALVTIGGAEF